MNMQHMQDSVLRPNPNALDKRLYDPNSTTTNGPTSTDGHRHSQGCPQPDRSTGPHDLDRHTFLRNYHECGDRGPSLWIFLPLHLAGLVAVWTTLCRQWAGHHGRLPPTVVPSEL